MNIIEKSRQYLLETFNSSPNMKIDEADKMYRYEHSIRVANIGIEIAKKEKLNEEALAVACLLHDIGYAELGENDDYMEHGRVSAKLARPFLEELGLNDALVSEICYGIAIHVEDKADFEFERTLLAVSVGDADNIDRFDAYRIYEILQWKQFDKMPLEEKLTSVKGTVENLIKLKNVEFATLTAKNMFCEKLDFQSEFYTRLLKQLEKSVEIWY